MPKIAPPAAPSRMLLAPTSPTLHLSSTILRMGIAFGN
jgi:hypothetical protein